MTRYIYIIYSKDEVYCTELYRLKHVADYVECTYGTLKTYFWKYKKNIINTKKYQIYRERYKKNKL